MRKLLFIVLITAVSALSFGQNKTESESDLSLAFGYGDNYEMAGVDATFDHTWPLFQKPGILWDKTNIKLGIKETYGFVVNSFNVFAEITPIAFFTIRATGGYDHYFWTSQFKGGLRPLTDSALTAWNTKYKNESSLTKNFDWTDSDFLYDNTTHKDGGGWTYEMAPSLQGQMGSIAVQYTFSYKYYDYSEAGKEWMFNYMENKIMKSRDSIIYNDAKVAYTFTETSLENEILAGLDYHSTIPLSSDMNTHSLYAFLYAEPHQLKRGLQQPFFGAQLGTHIIDPAPSIEGSLSWSIFIGTSLKF
ncbi:hypothetical protein [Spirochaeta cellobiosiphila]|uniref:hypothetical protein n=1 Tax=Spirochaeta cellobiosiphila TaxID=504483 RepID=UPI0003F93753|nr:hypothetical protein [Spirochaeta cellobiosiphila]